MAAQRYFFAAPNVAISTGAMLHVPYYLAIKAEVLYLAHRTSEALEAISEAEALVNKSEDRHWCAELHRLRGVFLVALDAGEPQIEASFREAIRTAQEQKSISLATRGEATYAEYRRQKAGGLDRYAGFNGNFVLVGLSRHAALRPTAQRSFSRSSTTL